MVEICNGILRIPYIGREKVNAISSHEQNSELTFAENDYDYTEWKSVMQKKT